MKGLFKYFCLFIWLFPLLLFYGCTKNHSSQNDAHIIATLFPQYDFARYIAGEEYNVEMLLPPGTESHTYDPSGKDMRKIYSCDLLLYTGSIMEPWVNALADDESCKNKLFDVSASITLGTPSEQHDHNEKEHSHVYDPHIWTSPKNALIMVDNILKALTQKYPESQELFTRNANELKSELISLDKDFTDVVSNAKRDTLYFGGRFAFYYFVRDYGLKYLAAYDSCNEDTEPTLKKLALMTESIAENNVKIILCEELSDNKVAKSLADATGASLMTFHSCHNVSKESFVTGVTYIDLMKQNLSVLGEALN